MKLLYDYSIKSNTVTGEFAPILQKCMLVSLVSSPDYKNTQMYNFFVHKWLTQISLKLFKHTILKKQLYLIARYHPTKRRSKDVLSEFQ